MSGKRHPHRKQQSLQPGHGVTEGREGVIYLKDLTMLIARSLQPLLVWSETTIEQSVNVEGNWINGMQEISTDFVTFLAV